MAKVEKAAAATATATEVESGSVLDQILERMPKAVERDRGKEMIDNLVQEALRGTVVWDRSVTKTITSAIESIDAAMSKQLAAIMHAPEFLKLARADNSHDLDLRLGLGPTLQHRWC